MQTILQIEVEIPWIAYTKLLETYKTQKIRIRLTVNKRLLVPLLRSASQMTWSLYQEDDCYRRSLNGHHKPGIRIIQYHRFDVKITSILIPELHVFDYDIISELLLFIRYYYSRVLRLSIWSCYDILSELYEINYVDVKIDPTWFKKGIDSGIIVLNQVHVHVLLWKRKFFYTHSDK